VTKVVSIIGARPQFIKAAPVSRALRSHQGVREIIVHTGQHYDENMSAVFFRELEIPEPDHDLGIGSGPHGAQSGRMLEAIERVLVEERPEWTLVYGDTNSTLAGALAAAKLQIPVAHVEAGLRSFNRAMPEEVNRIVADHVADLLFAPTRAAVANLVREGLADRRVELVGDVMYDAALYYGERSDRSSGILRTLGLGPAEYVVATIHRAENTDDPVRLRAVFDALAALSERAAVVVPLHPRTRKRLAEEGWRAPSGSGLRLIEPVGYLDMTMLERHARLVVTDSGGVQKEAFFQRVPCVTLRTETEWVELVEAGWNTLVAPEDPLTVADALRAAFDRPLPQEHPVLYGAGQAADRVAELLLMAAR